MKRLLISSMLSLTTFLAATGQTIEKTNQVTKKNTQMNTEILKNAIVKKAIDALQTADKTTWYSLFTTVPELYDDGHKMNFKTFFDKALGHERFTSIDKIENDGLDIYGKFHSDQWGDFKTYFRFHINTDNKIERLDIGQASY